MIAIPTVIDVPLRHAEGGSIRIGQTRVTLNTLIHRYQAGDTPELIHAGFPTVGLGDIYAVVAYYLAHQIEVDAYLADSDQQAEKIRRKFEALPGYQPLTREMLLKRLEDQSGTQP